MIHSSSIILELFGFVFMLTIMAFFPLGVNEGVVLNPILLYKIPMPRGKPFRPFFDMIYKGIPDASWKTAETSIGELVSDRGSARLFLGHYTEDEIRAAFRRFSIQEKLDELGLGHYRIFLDASNPDHQELKLFPVISDSSAYRKGIDTEPIAEVILREALLSPAEHFLKNAETRPYLVIQWICLQNPLAKFEEKNLLPGQRYPGLGVGQNVLKMLDAMIHTLHLEGIVNRPEFLHAAIIYSRVFQFVNPEAQGRLGALRRDLAALDLWQIAWASENGHIIEDGSRTRFTWFQSEQVWTSCDDMVRYFESDTYKIAVREAEKKAGYVISPGAPDEFKPGRPRD
jgi:hypothetical protein